MPPIKCGSSPRLLSKGHIKISITEIKLVDVFAAHALPDFLVTRQHNTAGTLALAIENPEICTCSIFVGLKPVPLMFENVFVGPVVHEYLAAVTLGAGGLVDYVQVGAMLGDVLESVFDNVLGQEMVDVLVAALLHLFVEPAGTFRYHGIR